MKRTILLAIIALFYVQASQDVPATDPNVRGTAVNTTEEATHKKNSPQPPQCPVQAKIRREVPDRELKCVNRQGI